MWTLMILRMVGRTILASTNATDALMDYLLIFESIFHTEHTIRNISHTMCSDGEHNLMTRQN
jgi:hypothetical protein